MTRSLPEWIGKTPDSPVPPRVRVRVFFRYDGICQCGCGRTIRPGEEWDCEDTIAIINGGERRESNLKPWLREHHKNKTKQDVAEKSRTYRKRKAPSRGEEAPHNHPLAQIRRHSGLCGARAMTLVTPYDRFDRAAIIERAREIYVGGDPWPVAMRKAYGEALAQREMIDPSTSEGAERREMLRRLRRVGQ